VRDFTIKFTFSSKNPYFKETVLSKTLTVSPPSESEPKPKAYDLEAVLYAKPTTITWTSPEHNLSKKAPKLDPSEIGEYDSYGLLGSFFNWFPEEGVDEYHLGETLSDWWYHATEYAAGNTDALADDSDEEWDEEDSDDDPTKEIDLESEDESRPKKKSKTS